MHNLIEAPLALLGGVFTIASPCVLPILPIVLGTTFQDSDRTRPIYIVGGFVIAFSALGLLLSSASQHIVIAHETARLAGTILLGVTGVVMLWRTPYTWLMNHLSGVLDSLLPKAANKYSGKLGAFLLGISLGAVWTPCAGPVLASILILIAKAQDIGWSATLLVLYALGAGIPMLGIAYGGQFARNKIKAITKYTSRLQQVFGVLILATAIAIYFQFDVLLYAQLANFISI